MRYSKNHDDGGGAGRPLKFHTQHRTIATLEPCPIAYYLYTYLPIREVVNAKKSTKKPSANIFNRLDCLIGNPCTMNNDFTSTVYRCCCKKKYTPHISGIFNIFARSEIREKKFSGVGKKKDRPSRKWDRGMKVTVSLIYGFVLSPSAPLAHNNRIRSCKCI